MKTTIQTLIEKSVAQLKQDGALPADVKPKIMVDHTKDKSHGDFATNVAMMLAKPSGMKPREVAEKIIAALPESSDIEKVEIAGPGFINFFVSNASQQSIIPTILNQAESFGRADIGKGHKVLVEFVSANPTGPLHVGHGRGAAYGAAISDLLEAMGYTVHREYYVNDAGRQMNILAASVWLRYLELCGGSFDFPSNGYKGDYVIDIANMVKEKFDDQLLRPADQVFEGVPRDEQKDGSGDKEAHIDALIVNAQTLLGEHYQAVFNVALNSVLDDIKDDLSDFGVEFQEWFSEKYLEDHGMIEHCLDKLTNDNFTYEKDGALWFKSTDFGEDKDRVLKRADGRTTYFASDVAYHLNKIERGFDKLIDVLGADHHGYVPRVRASMRAMGVSDDNFTVPLVQFAVLYRGGEKVQMSTRSGSFVTLRELRDDVGKDAARFFYVMRKPEQHMDFDLDLAKSKSNENPVYYIQYAHARVCSVFRQLDEKQMQHDEKNGLAHLGLLSSDYEIGLMTLLSKYPEVLKNSAINLEPHQLINYLRDLANAFHTYYNAEQFLVEDADLRDARLCLIKAMRQVLSNALQLLSVSAPEKM